MDLRNDLVMKKVSNGIIIMLVCKPSKKVTMSLLDNGVGISLIGISTQGEKKDRRRTMNRYISSV